MRIRFPHGTRRFVVVAVLVAAFTSTGCGRPKLEKLSLLPVIGKVRVGDVPLAGIQIMYHPDPTRGNRSKWVAMAQTREDGSYELVTNGQKGAPRGWYKVTVMVPPQGGAGPFADTAAPIHVKYASLSSTDLSIEVTEGGIDGAYDLRLVK
jgi:hypothetical protein